MRDMIDCWQPWCLKKKESSARKRAFLKEAEPISSFEMRQDRE